MAVAFDAVGPSSAGTSSSSSTTLSWSHTCTGSNLCLLVGVALGNNADGGSTMSATYNSVSMTSLGTVHTNNSFGGFIQLWYLKGPATGANTVAITESGGSTPLTLVGGSISLTGVDQTSPVGTPVTAAGSSGTASVAVTGTTSGNMIVDAVACGSAISTSTQTNRWKDNAATTSGAGNAAQSTAAAGGSVTMSYTVTSDWWGIIAVEVKAAAGSGGLSSLLNPPPPNRARLIRASCF